MAQERLQDLFGLDNHDVAVVLVSEQVASDGLLVHLAEQLPDDLLEFHDVHVLDHLFDVDSLGVVFVQVLDVVVYQLGILDVHHLFQHSPELPVVQHATVVDVQNLE